MPLSRLALRLAAYEALNPYATLKGGPWPTIAGGNVYDSRLDPVLAIDDPRAFDDFAASIEGKPIVILYTEEHETSPTSGEYPADLEIAELVVELMIAARGAVEIQGADGKTIEVGSIESAITDRQHEALLDLLEGQVKYLLDPQRMAASATLYRRIARELHHVHSVPMRDPARAVKVAARTVRMRIRIPQTNWPAWPTSPARTGLALLPAPLSTVAAALPATSSGGVLLAQLAGMIAQPPAPVPLDDIRLNANLDRAAAPTNPNGADSDAVGDVPLTGFVTPQG